MRTLIILLLTFLWNCEGANKPSYESCLRKCEGDKGICYFATSKNLTGMSFCELIYISCDGGCKGDTNGGGSSRSSSRSSRSGGGGGSRGGGGGSGGGSGGGGGGGGGGTIQFE